MRNIAMVGAVVAGVLVIGLVAAFVIYFVKAEDVQLEFDNRTNELVCLHLSNASADFGGCAHEVGPMARTSWQPGCGYGRGAEELTLTVILRVAETGRRIYSKAAECRVWQQSDREFVIEKRGDDFAVIGPLQESAR